METISSTKILGTSVSTESKGQILSKIIKSLKQSRDKFYIVTPNPEIMMYAMRDRSYQDILNRAQVSLPDGVGVLMAAKMLKKGNMSRITGVDFMVELVRQCAKEGLVTGFLGGMPGVAEKTVECLRNSYPDLIVGFTGSEWNTDKIKNESIDQRPKTSDQRPIDILFVAFGFPKQERWISENLSKIPVKAAMGVGGSFDYISGRVHRAPRVMRSLGLEWAFRLVVEPWRIKRQIALPKFAFEVIKERIRN